MIFNFSCEFLFILFNINKRMTNAEFEIRLCVVRRDVEMRNKKFIWKTKLESTNKKKKKTKQTIWTSVSELDHRKRHCGRCLKLNCLSPVVEVSTHDCPGISRRLPLQFRHDIPTYPQEMRSLIKFHPVAINIKTIAARK